MARRSLCSLAAVLLVAALVAGCGSGGHAREDLLVSAATSLKRAFTAYGERFAAGPARFSFAGSDELAAQIRTGARPDVFAAANTRLPDRLFAEGLVERPRIFAANRLVLAVPAGTTKVRSIGDLAADGVSIVIGAESVPVGSYTRRVLGRLDRASRAAILANVRSNEPDVGGVAAKLAQRAADAGFVYATDVVATRGRLRAIELADALEPEVAYAVAIVKGARNREAAQAFVAGLFGARPGASALAAAGFRPPPAT